MQENKIFSMLSLCQRAGKLYSGGFTCEKAIKSRKAFITIVSNDASDNTKKEFNDMCNHFRVKMYYFGTKETLGKYIGKSDRTVLCVGDINFSKKIQELLEQE